MMRRLAGAAISAGLILSVAGAPATAAKKGCELFTPGVEGAQDAPIAQLSDAATAETPLVLELTHPASAPVVAEGHSYVNIQIYSRKARPGLYIREEFDKRSDIDLHLYDNAGNEVASSKAVNLLPVSVGPVGDPSSGGVGYEAIEGFRSGRCGQYTLDSRSILTQGTDSILKIWLGRPIRRS